MTAKNNHGIVICTLLMTLMVVSVAFVLALKADNVYVDGVQQHQPLTASQVTNTVRALQRGTVYGITGITNVWSGAAPAGPVVVGVDLAKHTDWTVCVAMEARGQSRCCSKRRGDQ